jgi:8-oxo-dGTP pyrophosphatase MutT (NUDIX family)
MSYPVSAKGVLLLDGQVVLVKNPRDEWELPGGRVDSGEDHVQALIREFSEELAVAVTVEGAIDAYVFEVVPNRFVTIVTYGCALNGEFSPCLSEEHVDHCLWPIERLAEINLPEGYRRSAEAWARSSGLAEAQDRA